MNKSLSPDTRADLLVRRMTLDEKIQVAHGLPSMGFSPGFKRAPGSLGGDGFVPGIPRLGIPDQQQIGAGVGLTNLGRRVHGQATALPSSLAETSTWDPRMAYEYGTVIGRETRDEGFDVSLGGGVDLARESRSERNFEYHGGDPILAGTILAQELRAIQKQDIVATIKHFAVNDQESGRFYVSSDLNRRELRETDLLAFEIGVKDSGVGAVMCSYNRVNRVYSCENSHLLNEVLKLVWGFKGCVMSDWGATHSTVKAALSGLDQEMSTGVHFGDALKEAVEKREVPMSRLDNTVHRILRTLFAEGVFDNPPVVKPLDVASDAAVAQRVEEQGAVLLKNTKDQLPLSASTVRSIAVIGSHADVGLLSGGGSAQVDPIGGNALNPPKGVKGRALFHQPVWDPSPPLKAIRALAPHATVTYNSGDDFAAAAKLASVSDVAVVLVNQWTHEGADLPNLALPDHQDELIRKVAAANPRTIVVLENGDPVLMPRLDEVSAVLETWYPGQRGDQAIANILFGKVNSSGKLPISFPKSEADLPRLHIHPPPPGEGYFDVDYTEGLDVGYKWYGAKGIRPLFPFGYGLSYTRFSFSNIEVTPATTDGTTDIRVSFDLKNIGTRAGGEVAQVYLGLPASTDEPPKRLAGWAKVDLEAGQTRKVSVTINHQSASHPLSFWNTSANGWSIGDDTYKVYVGDSSQDIYLTDTLDLHHGDGSSAIP
jgi:beta-glucosidase